MIKNILITGGAGFIGSHFVRYMLQTRELKCINLDSLTYAGRLDNLADIQENPNYIFVRGNICDKSLINSLFLEHEIDTVVNFAAESHVDRSITEPEIFVRTNVLGTQVLLDCARAFWRRDSENLHCTTYKEGVKFLQVSTDEVYGSLGELGFFTETSPISPNSPYSASKASADLMVRAYHETYSLPVNITRCSNNYGPNQFPEKLIPLMISKAKNNESLPVYGDGLQIRDWLQVKDHCSAIATVLETGVNGEIYNVGGNNEIANIDIVKLILKQMDKSEDLIEFVDDRLGHDRRYAIDNTKITKELGWQPSCTFEEGLRETVEWYK